MGNSTFGRECILFFCIVAMAVVGYGTLGYVAHHFLVKFW